MIVVACAFALGRIPEYAEYCEHPYTYYKECTTDHIALIAVWQIGKILNYISPAVTALSTFFIGIFTYTLWKSNEKMWRETKTASIADKKSADHIPIVERAYVFATPMPVIENNMTVITLSIENFGQTPGFISEVYGWGSVTEPTGAHL